MITNVFMRIGHFMVAFFISSMLEYNVLLLQTRIYL